VQKAPDSEDGFKLNRRADFLRFFSGAEVLRLNGLLVFRVKNQLDHPRFGVTLKLRKKGRAVDRNRIKRWARGTFFRDRTILGPWDYNFVVARDVLDNSDLRGLRRVLASGFNGHLGRFQPQKERTRPRE
jgi:ribonuclease P protein component